MVLGIQVFGLAFGIFVLYMSFLQWKKREFTLNEWAFWSFFAIAFSGISLFPQIMDPIIATLKLERKLDLFIILGFMFLIASTLYTYKVVRKVQKGLEELVRQLALERAQEHDPQVVAATGPSRRKSTWVFPKKVNQKTKSKN